MNNKPVILMVRTTEEIRAKIKHVCKKEDRSMSNLAERFIKKGLKEWDAENPKIAFGKPQK